MDLNFEWCWNLLAEGAIFLWNCIRINLFLFFQTITALFSNRHCNLSKGRHKVRPRFLEGISRSLKNTTWDHRHWRIVCKKCPTYVLSALCLLYFVPVLSALFLTNAKFFRKLDENRWNTHLPSAHAQVSEHLIFPCLGTRRPELAGVMM